MLKRIPVAQLRVGMFLHELCGSWMDHPFWRSKFLLKHQDDIERIRASGIKEAWINTAKGLDVDGGVSEQDARAEVERELEFAASMPFEIEPETKGFASAIDEAAALYQKSRPQVLSMFNEARLGRAVDPAGCVPLVDEISRSVMENPGALISIARLKNRDEYTYMHSVAVCALMVALAGQLGLKGDAVREAGLGGMMHDLGKALMPLDVLNKPGKLTDAEFDVIRSHPSRGHELLQEAGRAGTVVLDVCLHHHERVDGTGYPHRLKGDALSLFAKMSAVCDVYDAVTSDRPYKNGWGPGDALRRMAQWKGHFDPLVFQAFVKTVGIYPVGTLVRLQSGRLAVVTTQHADSLLTPTVCAFYSLDVAQRITPELVELGSASARDKIAAVESPENWPFTDLDALWGAPAVV